jgi:CBS domain-containing protein
MNDNTKVVVEVPLNGPRKLKQISEQLRSKQMVPAVTVRELLRWFHSERRGSNIVYWINNSLTKAGLTTRPHFAGIYIDAMIDFVLLDATEPKKSPGDDEVGEADAEPKPYADPTYRIGKLRSANLAPLCVKPNQSIQEAITLMLVNDFSQLPVMTNERDVKGIISWISIGSRTQLGKKCSEVRECMDAAHVVSADASLFDAIGDIVKHQYVLVRDSANKITGIVTTSDLSLQFQQLSEPFLLLGEIENHIRQIIERGRFSNQELRACSDQADSQRKIEGIHNLSFGEYIRLLEKPESWEKVRLGIDRATFIAGIDRVREIRNDVMHFDPDGISEEDLRTLRNFARFFQSVGNVLSSA